MSNDFEQRGGRPAEIRADDDSVTVSGHAAVFNEETTIGSYFREVIMPGAFDSVLRDDVVFLVDHEGLPLARTRSGTLDLGVDKKGLTMRSTLDKSDPDVQRIVPKMERGDLDKMSFAFRVKRDEWVEPDDETELPLRKIHEFKRLHDVAIVTYPAYEGTDIGLRSLEAFRKSVSSANFSAAQRRVEAKLAHLRRRVGENG